jgi:hypothetical protein
MVQVSVSKNKVKERLTRDGILMAQKRMPAILFFIVERALENPVPQYWWGRGMSYLKPTAEMAIADSLREQGFRIVEHGPQAQQMAYGMSAGTPEISVNDALRLGQSLQADAIVIGRAAAGSAPNTMPGTGVQSYRGEVTLRAYRTTTGTEIAVVDKTAVTASADDIAGTRDALRGAGSLAGESLAAQIVTAWQQEGLKADRLEIQLTGTRNLANFVQFRRRLQAIAGVEDVQVRELKADTAVLNVAYRGNPQQLADELMVNAFETFGLNIYELAEGQMKIQLIPYGQAGAAGQPQ